MSERSGAAAAGPERTGGTKVPGRSAEPREPDPSLASPEGAAERTNHEAMTRITPAELKTLFLFEALSDEKLNWLAAHGTVQEFPAGSTVFTEGEPATGFYVLLSGTLALSRKVQQSGGETTGTDQRVGSSGATL